MAPRLANPHQFAEREQHILDVALSIARDESLSAVTIDRIAARVPFSKGTIYNHFSCKEDVLAGLCAHSMALLDGLFARALAFKGGSRERMLALYYAYLLYARLYPERFLLVITAKTPAIQDRASTERLELHRLLDGALHDKVCAVVEQALAAGDLPADTGLTAQQITFANWALAFGSISLLHQGEGNADAPCRKGLDTRRELFNNACLLLDGLGWRPLSRDQALPAVIRRIESDLFAAELTHLTDSALETGVSA